MKKHATTLLILTLLVLPGLVMAQGQPVVKAEVPFEFVANGTIMPGGDYTIMASGNAITALRISNGRRSILVVPNATESSTPYGESKLVFHRYGNLYFLSSVVREGNNRGYELRPGKAELELRAQAVRREHVTLLAKAR